MLSGCKHEVTGRRPCPLPAALQPACCLAAWCSPFPRFLTQPRLTPTDRLCDERNHLFPSSHPQAQSKINQGSSASAIYVETSTRLQGPAENSPADPRPTGSLSRERAISGQSAALMRAINPRLTQVLRSGKWARGPRVWGSRDVGGQGLGRGRPGLAPRRAKGHTPWSRGKWEIAGRAGIRHRGHESKRQTGKRTFRGENTGLLAVLAVVHEHHGVLDVILRKYRPSCDGILRLGGLPVLRAKCRRSVHIQYRASDGNARPRDQRSGQPRRLPLSI